MTRVHITTSRIRASRSVVVDLAELTAQEIDDAWHGPGGLTGPVGQLYAYRHATKQISPDEWGLPESVKAHWVN
jgi:hypothetical protein